MAVKKPKANKFLAALKSLWPFIQASVIAVAPLSVSNSVKGNLVLNLALGVAGSLLGVKQPQAEPELVQGIEATRDEIHAVLKPILPKPGGPILIPGTGLPDIQVQPVTGPPVPGGRIAE